ncbi:MAG: adenosine kinase [Alkalispirochaetaceae bacterium]
MISVFGLGNPLLDILMRGTYDDLEALGITLGSMNLVDYPGQQAVIDRGREPYITAGGSCANTVRAIAWLRRRLEARRGAGGSAGPAAASGAASGAAASGAAEAPVAAAVPLAPAYTGAVGKDENGDRFLRCLEGEGVVLSLARKSTPTGSSAILVTPDHERTMFTFLGACRDYELADLEESLLEKCEIFYTTGYMWDTENEEAAARRGIEYARQLGKLVAFDVADPFVVHRFREKLVSYLPGRIDILFANRDELAAMVGIDDEPELILTEARRFAPVVIMKVGKEGCYLASEEGIRKIPATPVEAKDTTGAGDSFAGGFLFARLLEADLDVACRTANTLAAAVVQVNGCDYSLLREDQLDAVLDCLPQASHRES